MIDLLPLEMSAEAHRDPSIKYLPVRKPAPIASCKGNDYCICPPALNSNTYASICYLYEIHGQVRGSYGIADPLDLPEEGAAGTPTYQTMETARNDLDP